MRILFLQFLPPNRRRGHARFDEHLGVLSSVLRQQGHATGLLPVTRFDEQAIRIKVAHFRPQFICADIAATCANLAHRTLGHISSHHFLPMACTGVFPTATPDRALSLPGVHAVVIGEPEVALPALLQARATADLDAELPGIWLNSDGAVVKNDLAPLTENLDTLPDADRNLFGYQRQIDATREAEVSAGRGCPHFCAYCLNDWLMEIYEGMGTFVRRRSPERICDEIEALRRKFTGIERIRFREHLFALDEDWLASFVEVYRRRCGLPLRCHIRANALTDRIADLLLEAGTAFVDVEVISGSDFVRNEIFDMELSESQIVSAFERLGRRGIATRAINYLGAPYASEVSIEETVALNRRIRPTIPEARVYYPFPRTRAAELCKESGWLSNRGEAGFARDDSILDIPSLSRSKINRLARRFVWDVHHPKESPLGELGVWIATGPLGRAYRALRRSVRPELHRKARRTDTDAGEVAEA